MAQMNVHERNMANMEQLTVKDLRAILKIYRPCMVVSELVKKVLQDHVEALLESNEADEVAESIEQVLIETGKKPIRAQVVNAVRPIQNAPSYKVFARVQIVNIPIRSVVNLQQANPPIQQNIVPVEQDLNEIRFVELPFYDIEKEIVKPMLLPIDEGKNGFFKCSSMTFEIPADLAKNLMNSPNDSLPRYEVQLRLALHNVEEEEEHSDNFPNDVEITLNGQKVRLPPKIKIRPVPGQLMKSKLESRPVNLTAHCDRTPRFAQKLKIEWRQDSRQFVIGIWIVKHINWEILRDQFIDKGDVQLAETRLMIKERLAEKDEILEHRLKMTLICPYSQKKMLIPVRSRSCSHLRCFDVDNHFQMNEKKPTWECPVCGKHCPYNSLVVDRYFFNIIQKVKHNVTEVELLPDGNWKIEAEKSTMEIPQASMPTKSTTNGYLTANRPTEVITLESSAEEEDTQIEARKTRKRKHGQMAPNVHTMITLDDK